MATLSEAERSLSQATIARLLRGNERADTDGADLGNADHAKHRVDLKP
jgi:hypothetical protein